MAESFSFDVVSDFDRQELVNTLDPTWEGYAFGWKKWKWWITFATCK